MTENNGLYIKTRTSIYDGLYKNGKLISKELIPAILFLEPEEKRELKTWRDVKDRILYKMQRGEYICGKPMTDKELSNFSKIVFKYMNELEEKK